MGKVGHVFRCMNDHCIRKEWRLFTRKRKKKIKMDSFGSDIAVMRRPEQC